MADTLILTFNIGLRWKQRRFFARDKRLLLLGMRTFEIRMNSGG